VRVKIGDVRLFFEVEGAKLRPDGATMREVPTVVLLHGGPGFDHSNFKPDFSRLTEIGQVVYLDHRGNGRSDRGDRSKWNLPQWGDDVRSFCEALEIERPIVMGISFGRHGCDVVRHAPSRASWQAGAEQHGGVKPAGSIARYVRAAGRGAGARSGAAIFDNPGPETMADYQKKCLPLYNRTPSGPESLLRSVMNLELMADFFKNESHTFNFLPELGRIKCPTLIAAGELDPITPVADAKDIAAAIAPGLARLEVFENAGHGAHRDQPDRFFKVLDEFILA
jgi:pimeloyl-ACP methyl ester carboxylesterase